MRCIVWVPPRDKLGRVIGPEPGGGTPSLCAEYMGPDFWSLVSVERAMWTDGVARRHVGLLLSFNGKPCYLSLARAAVLLDDLPGFSSSCTVESLAALLMSTFGGQVLAVDLGE